MRNRLVAISAVFLLALTLVPGPASGAAAKVKIAKEKQAVLDWLARPETVEKFGQISDSIWQYAELGLQEFRSSKLLADTLEEAGFTVERNLAGMPTCFVATYGSGKPVIGLLGEFDALPMLSQKGRVPKKDPVVEGAPGHGCGHNAMCTAAAAAAIAVKEAMIAHGIKGTIKVFGSPAEEIVASRPYMIRAGLFEGVDAVIDNHSSSGFGTGYGVDGNALFSTIFTFKGKTAHAAGAPWVGRSALDAVEIMDVATNYLREHLPLSQRLHYVILEGGEAPNVVPDKASVWYYVRNTDETARGHVPAGRRLRQGRRPGRGRRAGLDAGRQRHPPASRQQGRGRALPEEHRARRHARVERGGAGLRQGPAEGARGRGRRACRTRSTSSRLPRPAAIHRRRLVRRRRRDADRAHGDDQLPRRGARRHRPPLVERRLLVRLDGLEGPERRGQGHRRLGRSTS